MASGPQFQFSNLSKIVPDAYHGTDKANIQSIQKQGFRVGTGGNLYLGDGVYFYEGSKPHAIGYPKLKDKTCKSAVFRCEINLGRCIDLNNKQHKDALQSFAAKVKHLAYDNPAFRKMHNITSPDEITEPFIINLAATISGAETVRATHGLGNPLFAGSKILSETRLVIAVRDPKKILATYLDYVES
jgi:Poly(ADP-ribose) polymerase catalytic domain.